IPGDEILSEQQPESPSASIEADNTIPDAQESDFPEYPAFEVPPAIQSSEFITRIETITSSLSNPEIASAVGTQADVIALTTRLERLTQTLSRQETVSFENAIAINNLLNRVEMLSYPPTPLPVTLVPPTNFNFALASQPLVGIIDTGFSGNNPDIDYSRVTLGRDWVDNDSNPLLQPGEGSEHGTHILGIIGATRDNGLGIDGINDQAPLWLGRAIGSGKWADSLVEFVNAAQESGQPNAVVNLSLDLTQINPDGSVTTRYEFTPYERAAIEYARQHNVLIVVASGNDGGVMSALGQASQEFDNIITVGAAERVNDAIALSKAYDRTDYSSYGYGLDILAPGGSIDNPELSLTGDGLGTMAGSSVATAKVTGAVSQVWAANPSLSYRQVIEIIKNTATDLKETGWDLESGAGLLNMVAAVHLAKVTKPEYYQPETWAIPDIWSGEGYVTPNERAAATEFNGKYYEWESYTVAQGDTLSAIALRTMGNSSAPYYNFIAQKNSIANTDFIVTGQQILVPKQVPGSVQQPQPSQPQSQSTSPEVLQPQLVAPQSGEGKVPINSGQFLRTVTSNGVIIHYYTNGYLMVQPSGFQSWYALGSRIVRPPILNWPSPLPASDGNDTLATARQLDKTSIDLGNGWTPYGLNVSIKGDSIGNLDRYDYYSFTLDRSQYVNLKLDGLSADANLALIQDINNNGQIDPGEVLRSSRNLGTTSESITQFLNPGKYYIQVSAGIGNARTLYNLNLRSWLSVQPDNGPQPINGRQPVTPKIDSVYFSDVTGNDRADAIVINNWGTTTRQSNSNLFLPNETWIEHPYFGSHRSFFADVDGDGKADAIAVNDNIDPQFDGVYVKLSNGSEFLESKKWTDVGYNGKYGIFFADVTGDGKADAIVVNDGGVTVRRSDGTRFLPNETWTEIGYAGQFGTYFADVTGDGKADAIVSNAGGVTVRRSDGTRFLPNETWTNVGYGGEGGPGSIVKGSGPEVYLIDGIKRRHIPDPETLNYLGRITPQNYISDEDLNAFPLGVNLPSWRNGALVKGSGDAVYYMENGYRRHIPDGETFTARGFSWVDVQNISDGDLNAIPLGAPLPSSKNIQFQPINSRAEYLRRLYGSNSSAQITQNAQQHGGPIDSWAGLGANLYALAGGEVIEARNGINYGANSNNRSNWVNNGTIAIYNKELDMTFIYWHLQEGSIDTSLKGKTIAAGTLIGKEGKTGYVIGPSNMSPSNPNWGVHTHVEVHKGRVHIDMARGQAPANSGRLSIPSALGNGSWL
ncbi:MAG: S8 family serine peptidase, partial [Desertifilum sp.]|nr:S8 family serine peptidase [Desertifilum sp.]